MTVTVTVETARMRLAEVAGEAYAHFHRADRDLRKGSLDPIVRELVKIRASQLNGCAFCVDLHAREALELGEDAARIAQLPVWRESVVFTEAERAALAYADAATQLDEHGVTDEVWDALNAHFTEAEVANLVLQVALINAYNRIGVPLRLRPPSPPAM